MAKSVEAKAVFADLLQKFSEIKKAYYARVKGRVNPIELENAKDGTDTTFIVTEKIYKQNTDFYTTAPLKDGQKGRDSETKFEVLFYDSKSDTSVLKCYPVTGRTHQIRLHLKAVGHPIANDPKYGGVLFNDFVGKF